MEQTQLFQATVRTIRLRMKSQRREESVGASSVSDNSSILKKSRRKTDFVREATDVAGCITKLRDFLMKHRKDYINSAGYLVSTPSAMTDQERDEIDSAAEEFIHSCSEKIETLHHRVLDPHAGRQVKVHRQAVYESLREYLKGVCQLYSEQRAMRVKRIVDRKRIFRLQPEDRKRKALSSKENTTLNNSTKDLDDNRPPSATPGDITNTTRDYEDDSLQENTSMASNVRPDDGAAVVPSDRESESLSLHAGVVSSNIDDGDAVEDCLKEDERAEFEQENEQLFSKMNSMVDEVREIQGKVLEISRLQEIFSEKVLVQAKELDIIHGDTVEASENVKEGNEQVRGAIKNKASFRLWILFVLIVFSFSLLFLDWYN